MTQHDRRTEGHFSGASESLLWGRFLCVHLKLPQLQKRSKAEAKGPILRILRIHQKGCSGLGFLNYLSPSKGSQLGECPEFSESIKEGKGSQLMPLFPEFLEPIKGGRSLDHWL